MLLAVFISKAHSCKALYATAASLFCQMVQWALTNQLAGPWIPHALILLLAQATGSPPPPAATAVRFHVQVHYELPLVGPPALGLLSLEGTASFWPRKYAVQ